MIIYKISNIINGKVYIGQTIKSAEERWKSHCRKSSKCPKIYNAIVKYGKSNFKIEVLEICNSVEELKKKEQYWIEKHNSVKEGYNSYSDKIPQNYIKIGKKISQSYNNLNEKEKERKKKISSKIMKNMWKNEKYAKIFAENSRNTRMKENRKSFNVYEAIFVKKEGRNKVYKKGKFVGSWENQITCAEDMGWKPINISRCLRGLMKTYNNCIIEYTNL